MADKKPKKWERFIFSDIKPELLNEIEIFIHKRKKNDLDYVKAFYSPNRKLNFLFILKKHKNIPKGSMVVDKASILDHFDAALDEAYWLLINLLVKEHATVINHYELQIHWFLP
jgi:hypothetical protein